MYARPILRESTNPRPIRLQKRHHCHQLQQYYKFFSKFTQYKRSNGTARNTSGTDACRTTNILSTTTTANWILLGLPYYEYDANDGPGWWRRLWEQQCDDAVERWHEDADDEQYQPTRDGDRKRRRRRTGDDGDEQSESE